MKHWRCFFVVALLLALLIPCSAMATCNHEDVGFNHKETYKNTGSSTYHTHIHNAWRVCRSCGATTWTYEDKQSEEHSFGENDQCYYCGYKKTCSHTTKEVPSSTSYKIIAGNDKHHNVFTNYSNVCTKCSKTISTDKKTQVALHTFSGDTCTLCGYILSTGHSSSPSSSSSESGTLYYPYCYADPTTATSFVDGKLKASSVKVSLKPKYLAKGASDRDAQNLSKFSASTIEKGIRNKGYQYGLGYTLTYPKLAQTREYLTFFILRAPNGFIYDEWGGYVEYPAFSSSGGRARWSILGNEFFNKLLDTHGYIPTGKYYIDLYWDDMLVNTTTFQVY